MLRYMNFHLNSQDAGQFLKYVHAKQHLKNPACCFLINLKHKL